MIRRLRYISDVFISWKSRFRIGRKGTNIKNGSLKNTLLNSLLTGTKTRVITISPPLALQAISPRITSDMKNKRHRKCKISHRILLM